MPDSTGCPCGQDRKPLTDIISWIDDAALQAITADDGIFKIMEPLFGLLKYTQVDWDYWCSFPPPMMPTFTLDDFRDIPGAASKVLQAFIAAVWENHCKCSDCPPVTNCNAGGSEVTITHANGWQRPDPGQTEYRIPGGTDVWAQGCGVCWGLTNGITVTFTEDAGADWTTGVWQVCEGNGSGCVNRRWDACHDDTISLWVGGTVGPPFPGPLTPPAGVGPGPQPPACSNVDVCTAIEYIRQQSVRMEMWMNELYNTLAGNSGWPATLAGSYSFNLPNLPSIVGPLNVALPRAIEALAPVTPDQLGVPTITTLHASGVVDVTGAAWVSLLVGLGAIPYGSRGSLAPIWFSNYRSPGPGWYVIEGADGVIAYSELVFPEGQSFPVDPMATALVLELQPGVSVSVSVYPRDLS